VDGDYYVLITGSRDLNVRTLVRDALNGCLMTARGKGFRRLVVRHGHCPTGVDHFADEWAIEMAQQGHPVAVERHPAQNHPTQDFGPWPGAGPRRNTYMTGLPTHECAAFIGPCTSARCRRPQPHGSHGSPGCADLADAAGLPTTRMELWKAS